ncbi:uncharacterized protein PAC_15924 [Phialocephala subalpina]|uniref:Uncharacterized protein n=1 Tax=Phialocephala subalpina TaxID=576137 RepID=A0A1L7XLY6_9HELO|nr:uncharacterized protein PAC_15924 [Phialocephala subalpina]
MARLNLPCHRNEVLLPQDIDQAVDVFLRWLECEQSTISQYLDRYPSVRDSFLAATQQVAGHGLLLTPVGTPAEDLDNEPAEPAPEEIASWTGTVNYDGGDQRGDNRALVASDKLYPGTVDRSMGVKTPWLDPELHNPKSETSCRLATPVGSAIVDGTVSPSATNNERVDHCLQMPLDESIGGVDGENQSQTLAVGNRNVSALDAIPSDLSERNTENPSPALRQMANFSPCAETSHISIRARPEQTKRKRTAYCGIGGSAYLPLAGKVEALSKLSLKASDKFQRIAGPEILATLWYYLRAQRCSPSKQRRATPQTADPSDTSIIGQLRKYQLQYEDMGTSNEYFVELSRRLYFARIAGLYTKETSARRQTPPRRKRRRTNGGDCVGATNTSVNDTFVDFLLPQLQLEGNTRKNAKRRFENWRQIGRACAKLVESYDIGILLLLPQDLWDENLRELTAPQEDALIAHLDSSRPCLKTDIENLSSFLSALIEGQCLPKRTLTLEMLTEAQIRSGELEIRPLRELLEYSDDVNYASYLTDEALSELSQTESDASPHPPVDLEHQASNCVNLPNLTTSNDHNPSNMPYTDYLSSPIDWKEMDRFGEDFFYS